MGQPDRNHARWLYPLAVSAASLLAFVWQEQRVEPPLLPLPLFRQRSFALANMISFALGFSGYASLFFLSIFLQQTQTHSPAVPGCSWYRSSR